MITPKPVEGDYHPNSGYYIDGVPEGDLVQMLQEQKQEVLDIYGPLGEERSLYRYGEGKWSLKELLGHLMDTERIAAYRLMCIARGDRTPLPRHPELFVNGTQFDRRPFAELLEEYRIVREATVALVRGLTQEELSRAGTVNEVRNTAAATAYFILGHTLHHLNVVRERYLPSLALL
ncbi:DinB family protein [Cohnella sp. REN36]|uniref:DinB family protein n=1 Tax=Cohnella sp. REN36 TaxID=2887347 RepID=UPI001D13966B|nr:DinB family protein [Cohnella sp. REN36]MCC3373796.1 DinB family protein [Cohnella sp. REN36]